MFKKTKKTKKTIEYFKKTIKKHNIPVMHLFVKNNAVALFS